MSVVSLNLIINNQIVKVKGDSEPTYGATCVKGRFGLDFVQRPDRLTKPLVRKDGKLVECSWDEALDTVANKLGAIKKEYGSPPWPDCHRPGALTRKNFASRIACAWFASNNVSRPPRLFVS